MSRTVTFEHDYLHVWPSRAATLYRAEWRGRVKDEVAQAARDAGKLKAGSTRKPDPNSGRAPATIDPVPEVNDAG